MRLLIAIPTLDPVFGGPVEALRQMVVALIQLGHQPDTVTLDTADAPWLPNFPGVVHALGPSHFNYRFNARLLPWLKANAKHYEVMITHGIWQYQSFAVWRASRNTRVPYLAFVNGALDPWFKHAFPLKHLKKWLYWTWAEYWVLRHARAVLFKTEEERLLARESFWLYHVNEAIVPNGISEPAEKVDLQREAFLRRFPNLRDKRLLLFLSRIHPKKGCDLLIKAFGNVAKYDSRLHLVLAGPDQLGLKEELSALAHSCGVEQRMTWTGMLNGDQKWGAFHAAEVFVLPSHSENFGMVIVEALARGLPVLTTNKVNIWREIDNARAGFIAADTEAGATQLLVNWLQITGERRRDMARCARSCFAHHFEIRKAAERLIDVIQIYGSNGRYKATPAHTETA